MTKNLQYFSTQEGFISNSVFAINEDHQGNMWFGTDQGVYQYNGKTFRNFNQKDGLQHIDISRRSILVDKSGKIWVGTHRGVYQYDAEADQQGSLALVYFHYYQKSTQPIYLKINLEIFGLLRPIKEFLNMMEKQSQILMKKPN
jgi:ligand-binding sensor domain-containing protein